ERSSTVGPASLTAGSVGTTRSGVVSTAAGWPRRRHKADHRGQHGARASVGPPTRVMPGRARSTPGGVGRRHPSGGDHARDLSTTEGGAGMDETRGNGPVDVVLLRFPGNQFNGQIGPALRDLVVKGLVRV